MGQKQTVKGRTLKTEQPPRDWGLWPFFHQRCFMQGPRLPPSPEAWSSQVPCPPMFWWWALYSQASSRRLLLATKGSRHLSSFGFSRSQRSSSSDIEAKGVGLHRNIYRYFELDVVFSAICHICISFICTDAAYNYIFDLHFSPPKGCTVLLLLHSLLYFW